MRNTKEDAYGGEERTGRGRHEKVKRKQFCVKTEKWTWGPAHTNVGEVWPTISTCESVIQPPIWGGRLCR